MASDFRRTMIIDINFFSTNNTVIHTENCKITVDLNYSPSDLQKKLSRPVESKIQQRNGDNHMQSASLLSDPLP